MKNQLIIRLGSIILLYFCQFLYILIYMFRLKSYSSVSIYDKDILVLLRIPLLRILSYTQIRSHPSHMAGLYTNSLGIPHHH